VTVPQSLWRDVEVAPLGALEASARVAVVLDGEAGDAARTVAALADQSYPEGLLEVIGPGAGGEPDADILIFLQAGSAPAPQFVEAHARWHHAVADVVSFGSLLPEGTGGEDPLDLVVDLTRDFTDLAGGYHLAAAEGSLAVRRDLYLDAGGAGSAPPEVRRFDLAQRLHSAGAVFVGEAEAVAHAASEGVVRTLAAACETGSDVELELPAIAAVAALPPFRATGSPRRHTRPAVAVNLHVARDTPTEEALGTIRAALAGRLGDLELRVQLDESHPGQAEIAAAVAADPRASFDASSLDEGCEAPFQVSVPAVAALDPRTLADLHELALEESAGALHVTVPGAAPQDAMIEVVATAAWRRAKRLESASGEEPLQVIGRLFGERWLSGVEVSTRMHGVAEPQVTEHGPLAAATDVGHERNAHLRFRDRANDLAARAADVAQRTMAERLRARAERQAAERVESRLADRD
jgi:hypothetical protein